MNSTTSYAMKPIFLCKDYVTKSILFFGVSQSQLFFIQYFDYFSRWSFQIDGADGSAASREKRCRTKKPGYLMWRPRRSSGGWGFGRETCFPVGASNFPKWGVRPCPPVVDIRPGDAGQAQGPVPTNLLPAGLPYRVIQQPPGERLNQKTGVSRQVPRTGFEFLDDVAHHLQRLFLSFHPGIGSL